MQDKNKKNMYSTKDLLFKVFSILLILVCILSSQKLFSQDISTVAEIYDFEVGDEFHLSSVGTSSGGGDVVFLNKKILEKYYSSTNDTLFYTIEKISKQGSSPWFAWDYLTDTVTFDVTNLDDLILSGDIDSVYSNPDQFNGRLINYAFVPGSFDQTFEYVNGCGRAYFRSYQSSGGYSSELESYLTYFKKGDETWGEPQYIFIPTFANQDATWNVAKTFPNADSLNPSFVETSTEVYGYIGGTIITGKEWKKYYSTSDSSFSSDFNYLGNVRDENGIVYFMDTTNAIDTLYNFNLGLGHTVQYEFGLGTIDLHVININYITIDGEVYKRWYFSEPDFPPFYLNEVWIENIGSIHGPLFPKYPTLFETEIPDSLKLTCYKVQNSIVWNDPDYEDCYTSILLNSKNQSEASFSLFPNPARDFITIENKNSGIGELEILSITSKTIKRTTFSNNQKVNISELKPGIYFIKIEQKEQQIFKKLIKE